MAVTFEGYQNVRVNPAVYRLTLAALNAADAVGASELSEPDRIKAYLTVFNTIRGLTNERPETVQADTERLWGLLSDRSKRDMATNPASAIGVVKEAMGRDPALAGKLPHPGADAGPPTSPGHFDEQGLNPFDRLVKGNRIAGFASGNTSYSGLAGSVYDPTKGIGSLTRENFRTSEFYRAGLDLPTTMLLASQGFSPTAIVQAARLTGELGIDVKGNAPAIARLQRDVPGIDKSLRDTRDNWKEVGRLEREAEEARTSGNAARAAELQRQADEARKRAEEHDRRERERVAKTDPARVPDMEQVQRNVQNAHAGAKAAGIDPSIVEGYRQGDPDATWKYKAHTADVNAGGDEGSKKGAKQLDAALEADAKLKKKAEERVKAAKTENDDLLSMINAPPPPRAPKPG